MKKTQIKFDKELLYLIPTAAWILVMTLMNYFCASHILNSDISAELVLAKELSDSNKLVTPQWF